MNLSNWKYFINSLSRTRVEDVGFTSQRYFSTAFKQVKGITPTDFRKDIKEKKKKE
jgi:YesN/AraC family two-component response regulator